MKHPEIERIERVLESQLAKADRIKAGLEGIDPHTANYKSQSQYIENTYWFTMGIMLTLTAFAKAGLYQLPEGIGGAGGSGDGGMNGPTVPNEP